MMVLGLAYLTTKLGGPCPDGDAATWAAKRYGIDRRPAMRKIASWIFGLLASMIVGGMFGAWLLNSWLVGGVWGVLAGAFTFACFHPWPTSTPNSDGDPKAPSDGPGLIVPSQKRSPNQVC